MESDMDKEIYDYVYSGDEDIMVDGLEIELYKNCDSKCSMPNCRINLVYPDENFVNIGTICHIESNKSGERQDGKTGKPGPRFNQKLSDGEYESYHNKIILCRNCHWIVDNNEKKWNPVKLKEIKRLHEGWVKHNKTLPEVSHWDSRFTESILHTPNDFQTIGEFHTIGYNRYPGEERVKFVSKGIKNKKPE